MADNYNQNRINNQNMEDEIDLLELFMVLWGNVWKLILCAVLGGAIAFCYTFFMITPLYEASSTIYLVSASNAVINISDLQLGQKITSDYSELAKTRPMLENVLKETGLEGYYSSSDLKNMLSITNPKDTALLKFTVTNPDPELAARLANAFANQAILYIPEVMETTTPNIAESAVAASKPVSPNALKNTVIGILAGGICMGAILVVQFLLNDSVTTEEDMEKYFGIVPLAVIPKDATLDDGHRKNHKGIRGHVK